MKDGVFFIKPILTVDCFKNNFLYAGTFDKAAISTMFIRVTFIALHKLLKICIPFFNYYKLEQR